jgi:hypothetical protein
MVRPEIQATEVVMRLKHGLTAAILGAALATAVIVGTTAVAAPSSGSTRAAVTAPQEDCMFQVLGYHTANQGYQTINFYLHYRYRSGLPTAKYPNYLQIRSTLLSYMKQINPKRNLFWEILNTQICGRILHRFPLQAITCQFQVHPDNRPGLPYEPGYHSSVVTYGNIQPLAIPGP